MPNEDEDPIVIGAASEGVVLLDEPLPMLAFQHQDGRLMLLQLWRYGSGEAREWRMVPEFSKLPASLQEIPIVTQG